MQVGQIRRGVDSACQFNPKAVSFSDARPTDSGEAHVAKKKNHMFFRETAQSILPTTEGKTREGQNDKAFMFEANTNAYATQQPAIQRTSAEAIKVYSGDVDTKS